VPPNSWAASVACLISLTVGFVFVSVNHVLQVSEGDPGEIFDGLAECAPPSFRRSVHTSRCRRFSVGLRLLISQQIGQDALVPLAIDHVERDPLAEGDFYAGDLLDALMRRVPQSYWQAHEDQRARVRAVAEALDPDETFDVLYAQATEFLGR
jgi:hypothetical protein